MLSYLTLYIFVCVSCWCAVGVVVTCPVCIDRPSQPRVSSSCLRRRLPSAPCGCTAILSVQRYPPPVVLPFIIDTDAEIEPSDLLLLEPRITICVMSLFLIYCPAHANFNIKLETFVSKRVNRFKFFVYYYLYANWMCRVTTNVWL